MAKGRVYRRGTIRSLTKPERKEKPHHWMKAKAIGMYLNKRQNKADADALLSTFYLITESGDYLTTESGDYILVET